jgi:hypothetical protein
VTVMPPSSMVAPAPAVMAPATMAASGHGRPDRADDRRCRVPRRGGQC